MTKRVIQGDALWAVGPGEGTDADAQVWKISLADPSAISHSVLPGSASNGYGNSWFSGNPLCWNIEGRSINFVSLYFSKGSGQLHGSIVATPLTLLVKNGDPKLAEEHERRKWSVPMIMLVPYLAELCGAAANPLYFGQIMNPSDMPVMYILCGGQMHIFQASVSHQKVEWKQTHFLPTTMTGPFMLHRSGDAVLAIDAKGQVFSVGEDKIVQVGAFEGWATAEGSGQVSPILLMDETSGIVRAVRVSDSAVKTLRFVEQKVAGIENVKAFSEEPKKPIVNALLQWRKLTTQDQEKGPPSK